LADSSYADFFIYYVPTWKLLRCHVEVITFPRESYYVATWKLLRSHV